MATAVRKHGLRVRLTKYVPDRRTPQTPNGLHSPQLAFLTLNCNEALYGGAAGGGKSDALLMAALQYADVPGYAALILRRTYSELAEPGAIMDRAKTWLLRTDARWSEQHKIFTFPSGARLSFGFLQHSTDRLRYQGAEFQFCVASDTPVLMADGDWRPISAVNVGDEVTTLEGPRRVYRVHRPGEKPCVRVSLPTGSAVVSASHRLLTAHGWASPQALLATLCHAAHSTGGCATDWFGEDGWPGESPPWDSALGRALGEQGHPGTNLRASDAWSAAAESGYAASADGRLGGPLPPAWFVQLVLHEPVARSEARANGRRGELDDGCEAYGAPSWRADCRSGLRCGDARSPSARAIALAGTPSRGDAAARLPTHWLGGDPASALAHSPLCSRTLVHPYTSAAMAVTEGVRCAWARMAPAGEREVRDLSVEGAAHYIAWPGIISANCGFDELTQFDELDYLYLHSRLRKPEDGPLSLVPLRMRAASNPGGPGHHWVRSRFIKREPQQDEEQPPPAHERRFIPAKIDDNPSINKASYIKQLQNLDARTRKQYLDGNWDVREAGACFTEFEYDRHTIEGTRPLGSPYPVARGLDWGHHHMPVLWIMVQQGGAFVFDEWHGIETTTPEAAKPIRLIDADHALDTETILTYYDPAGLGTNLTTGVSEAATLEAAGIPMAHQDERFSPEHRTGLIKNMLQHDRLWISRDRCPYLIECLERAVWDKVGVNGIPKDAYKKDGKWDHHLDALGEALARLFPAEGPPSAVETAAVAVGPAAPGYYSQSEFG